MRQIQILFALLFVACGCVKRSFAIPPTSSNVPATTEALIKREIDERNVELPSVQEAGRQARLLHETIHATLQIVHLRYFRDDEGLPLPASTMKSVFRELEERQHVQMRWLAVNTPAMHLDHEPKDAFEHKAVEVLASGKDVFESTENDVYRFAGAITLGSECLSCHLSKRSSNQEKVGALLIRMRAQKP